MNTTRENKAVIYIFSDPNFLAVSILENLLSKQCFVNIISKDEKKWEEKTKHIASKSRFTFIREKDFKIYEKIDYAIFCSGFIRKQKDIEHLDLFKRLSALESTKLIFLLPFEKFSFKLSAGLNVGNNAIVAYVGDLLGPRLDFESDLFIPELLNNSLTFKKMEAPVGEVVYPVFCPEVAKSICNWLLSFGPFGKEVFILGKPVSISDFWKINNELVTGIKLVFNEKLPTRSLPKNYEIFRQSTNLKLFLSETYRYMSSGTKAIALPKVKIRKKLPKRLFVWSSLIFFLLIFPFIMTFSGAGLLYYSYRQALGGQVKNIQSAALLAKTFFAIGSAESAALKVIPIFGKPYQEAYFFSSVGGRSSSVVLLGPSLLEQTSELFSKVLGNEPYDPQIYSDKISNTLSTIYQNLLLVQADTKVGLSQNLISARWLSEKVDFEKTKNLLVQGDNLTKNLPETLGKGEKKTYLILFQNNMELRPTGGFIGSYGVASFDGGRMTELNVNDVYSADGQLRGHVEPPSAIKKYLGEANWWLRDSNWDPDFPTSARRAEWFLDKETDTQVDGVTAIDLSLIRSFLKVTGSVFLPDYNMDITEQNLYEKTQQEVEENFFPGSRKKASFLTALSRDLVSKISSLKGSQRVSILESVFKNLQARHVQVFLHNTSAENSLADVGWGGGVIIPDCGDNCYQDYFGTVEANLGVNKANYFVKRSADINVKNSGGSIERALRFTLTNSANTALGPSGTYKSYVRFLIPSDAEVTGFASRVGQTQQNITPEILESGNLKEVGAWIEILGGQSVEIDLSWRSKALKEGEGYAFYIRKQAGIDSLPLALTVNGDNVYNTELVEDLWIRKF